MTTLKDAQRIVNSRLGKKQDMIPWKPATLGDGKGTVSTGNNMVYCRLSENSSVIEVLNLKCQPVDGLRVRIAKTPEMPLVWQVIGQDDQRADENGNSGGGVNYGGAGPHHTSHEYLGVDQVSIDWRQINTLRVYAYSGFTIGVIAGLLPRPGADLVVPSQTLDLTSHVPAAGALYVLISIDSTGAIVATDGTAASGTFTLTLGDIPDTPSGNFRLAAVRLYTGQTAISETTVSNDIRDLRWPQERLAAETPGLTEGITTYYLSSDYFISNSLLDPVRTVHTEVGLPRAGDNVSTSILINTWDTKWNYPGLSVFQAGEWRCTLEAESTDAIQFYFKAYRVDNGGTETSLLTSELSDVVTTRQSITLSKVSASLATATADRLRIKVYMYLVSAIPDTTTATIYYDGAVDSKLSLPGAQTSILLAYDSILAGNSSGVAAAVSVAEQTLVGRITSGHVDDLSVAQVQTLIGCVTGSGTAPRIAQFTGPSTIGDSNLIGAGAGVLTLTAAGAYNLTVPETMTSAGRDVANTFTAVQTVTGPSSTALTGVFITTQTKTNTAAGVYKFNDFTGTISLSGDAGGSQDFYLINAIIQTAADSRVYNTASLRSFYLSPRHFGTGTISSAYGGYVDLYNVSTGIITTAFGYSSIIRNAGSGAGKITSVRHFSASNLINAATTSDNQYAFYSAALTTATSNYLLYGAGLGRVRIGDDVDIVGGADRSQLVVTGYSTQAVGTALVKFTRNDAAAGVSAMLGLTGLGSGANGDGVSLTYAAKSSTTAAQTQAQISTLWIDATHASRKAALKLYAYDTAQRLGVTVQADGVAARTIINAAQEGAYATTAINLTLTSAHHWVKVTAACTQTLPTAVGITGREYIISATAAGVIVDGDGTETINGYASWTMSANSTMQVKSDGANWIII